MRVIWKFPLTGFGWTEIALGHDPKVVLVATDPATSNPTLWIEHGGEHLVMRSYRIVPTGCPIEPGATHVGSCIQGPYVWHIYEMQAEQR